MLRGMRVAVPRMGWIVGGVLVACATKPRTPAAEAPTETASHAEKAPRTPQPPSASSVPPTTVALESWGVAIDVPPGTATTHEPEARRYVVELRHDVVVALTYVDAPMPAEAALAAEWDSGKDLRNLGQGVTPHGARFALRAFSVRVGFPGKAGQTVHTFKGVGRAYAILPMGDDGYVRCTGYVERSVESAEDPGLRQVASICNSLRPSP